MLLIPHTQPSVVGVATFALSPAHFIKICGNKHLAATAMYGSVFRVLHIGLRIGKRNLTRQPQPIEVGGLSGHLFSKGPETHKARLGARIVQSGSR